jgi:hypothetical protein
MTKKIFNLIAVTLLSTMCCTACDREKVITPNELPKKSQEFLATHFSGVKVTLVSKEYNDYDVWLDNDFELSFTHKGEWYEVDGNRNAVPQSVIDLLPKAIANYVSAHFPNTQIVSVNREPFGYDVDLSNGLDLEFDSNGNIREIDD